MAIQQTGAYQIRRGSHGIGSSQHSLTPMWHKEHARVGSVLCREKAHMQCKYNLYYSKEMAAHVAAFKKMMEKVGSSQPTTNTSDPVTNLEEFLGGHEGELTMEMITI